MAVKLDELGLQEEWKAVTNTCLLYYIGDMYGFPYIHILQNSLFEKFM